MRSDMGDALRGSGARATTAPSVVRAQVHRPDSEGPSDRGVEALHHPSHSIPAALSRVQGFGGLKGGVKGR